MNPVRLVLAFMRWIAPFALATFFVIPLWGVIWPWDVGERALASLTKSRVVQVGFGWKNGYRRAVYFSTGSTKESPAVIDVTEAPTGEVIAHKKHPTIGFILGYCGNLIFCLITTWWF